MRPAATVALLVSLCASTAGASRVHGSAGADAPGAPQDAVPIGEKAAFLLNLARFIEWPAFSFDGPDAPLDICVFRDAQFADALAGAVAGERAAGRRLEARPIAAPAEARRCHLVFVPRNRTAGTAALAAAIDRRPVISVGETDEFFAHGGIVHLFEEEGRPRFSIDAPAADRQGVHVSSHLLRLARSTRREDPR